jgi:hypothetical protein
VGIEAFAAAIVTAVIAIGGWVWRLAWKLASNEGKIQAAEILAAGANAKAELVENDLAEHREHVAAEYVSRDAMKEVTSAINRLGDRLDGILMHFVSKQ